MKKTAALSLTPIRRAAAANPYNCVFHWPDMGTDLVSAAALKSLILGQDIDPNQSQTSIRAALITSLRYKQSLVGRLFDLNADRDRLKICSRI